MLAKGQTRKMILFPYLIGKHAKTSLIFISFTLQVPQTKLLNIFKFHWIIFLTLLTRFMISKHYFCDLIYSILSHMFCLQCGKTNYISLDHWIEPLGNSVLYCYLATYWLFCWQSIFWKNNFRVLKIMIYNHAVHAIGKTKSIPQSLIIMCVKFNMTSRLTKVCCTCLGH